MDALIGVLALGTGVVVLATSVLTLALSIRNRKKVQEVHVLVNSQRTELETRIDQLAGVLKRAGIDLPPPDLSEE